MESGLWLTLCVCPLLLLGCQSSSRNDPTTSDGRPGTPPESNSAPATDRATPAPPRILGLEKGWELAPAATYTASQTPSEVVIKARGDHPTSGYQTKLVMSPLRIYPPQWMLAQKRPTGVTLQVVTPFEVTASFGAREPIKAVNVTDAAGKHVVSVEQARD